MDVVCPTLDGDAVVHVDFQGCGVVWMSKFGTMYYEDGDICMDMAPTGRRSEDIFERPVPPGSTK